MTTDTQALRKPADGVRGEIHLNCSEMDCPESFKGDDLASLAQRGARHWNREHGDQLKRHNEVIDWVEYGGHHLHGDAYEVRKYPVCITSFDVMERIGRVDGRLVPADDDKVCPQCLHEIPNEADRMEDDPDDRYNDAWTCRACAAEEDIDRRQNVNRDLGEYA